MTEGSIAEVKRRKTCTCKPAAEGWSEETTTEGWWVSDGEEEDGEEKRENRGRDRERLIFQSFDNFAC